MRDHAVWEENRRTWHFIRANELEFHRKWDVWWKHQAIGLFLSWWICHLRSGSNGQGSIISASSYEHSSLSASESQLYWVTSERFCAHKGTVCCVKGLFTGFFDAHYIMSLYLNLQYICMYTVYKLYNDFLKDQSEFKCEISFETLEELYGFVLHFEVYLYTVKWHLFLNKKKENKN